MKWHLAHTTWFFEIFIPQRISRRGTEFHPDFVWLFNSYYKSLGKHPEKKLRASFSRPPESTAILDYRCHVEDAMRRLMSNGMPQEAEERLILGLNHEQQHQELICYRHQACTLDAIRCTPIFEGSVNPQIESAPELNG